MEMSYEYLIRKAFGCGRYGVAGADADTYRRYQRILNRYQAGMEQNAQNTNQLAFEAGIETGKVVAFLNTAFHRVKITMDNVLTDDQFEQLEGFGVTLLEPSQENIEAVIGEAENLFQLLGLQVG